MIYFYKRSNGDVKIGTTSAIRQRKSSLKAEHGNLELIGLIEGGRDVERQLHTQFRNYWTGKGEWFRDSPELRKYLDSCTQLDSPKDRPNIHVASLEKKAREQGVTVRELIIAAVEENPTYNKAAKKLGMDRQSLAYQIQRLGLRFQEWVILYVDGVEVSRFPAKQKQKSAS